MDIPQQGNIDQDYFSIVADPLLVLPSVTGIIFDDQNRILLVRQTESGLWSAPGAVDPEEMPADAVVQLTAVNLATTYGLRAERSQHRPLVSIGVSDERFDPE
jgi:hypothetical protein